MFKHLLETIRRWFARFGFGGPATWLLLAALILSQAMCQEGGLAMKVIFRQTGGFAAPASDKTCELDIRSMPTADAARLRSLVERSHLAEFKSKERPAAPKGAADFFIYTITVETDQGVEKISFDEMNVPQSVIPLLEYLSDRCT